MQAFASSVSGWPNEVALAKGSMTQLLQARTNTVSKLASADFTADGTAAKTAADAC